MNEHIQKLAKKSGATLNEGFDGNKNFVYGITMSPEELEKFAKMLIHETLDVARAGVEFGNGMESAVETYFEIKL